MKNTKRCMVSLKLLVILTLLQFACKKDGGYYNAPDANGKVSVNTYEYLKSKPGVYDSLIAAVDRLGLKETLIDSNITLFAVTNQSFQLAITNLNNLRRQSDKDPVFLGNIDHAQFDTMVSYYIIRGRYTSDSLQLQDGLDLKSVRFGYPMHGKSSRAPASGYVLGGPQVVEFSNTKGSKFNRNWATTTTGSNNIETTNGIVHVVSPDHIFGFDEFVKRLTFVPAPANYITLIGGILTISRDNNGGPDNGEGSLRMIDGDVQTKFLGDFLGHMWVKYELNTPEIVSVYTLTSANDAPDRDPVAWTMQGSNDNIHWDELDRISNFVFEQRFQLKIFKIPNKISYKYYKWDITQINGSGAMQLSEFTLNGAK